jgi:hypothetical protein
VFREQMRREMTIDAVRQRDVVARIAVSEREIRRWIEQQEAAAGSQIDYDISQILVAMPEDPTPEQRDEAQARAADLHARLLAGEDFAELAVAVSSGQQALTGGRLGWRSSAQLPEQFAPPSGRSLPARSVNRSAAAAASIFSRSTTRAAATRKSSSCRPRPATSCCCQTRFATTRRFAGSWRTFASA